MTDTILETHLVQLLSQLEFQRAHLEQNRVSGRESLAFLHDMIARTAGFAEQHLNTEPHANRLAKALVAVSEFRAGLTLYNDQPTGWLGRSMAKLFSSGSRSYDPQQVKNLFYDLKKQALLILQHYFSLFAKCFSSPTAGEQWEQTCSVFLKDLTYLVDGFQE